MQPGMEIFRPENLAENVPYNVLVSNQVQNIGVDIFDGLQQVRLFWYVEECNLMSFGSIGAFDDEIAHTWGPAIGQSLGMFGEDTIMISTRDIGINLLTSKGRWDLSFDASGAVGHFSYLEDAHGV